MKNIKAVILAAGKGTRMKSNMPKVLHTLCGKPMIQYVVDAARGAGIEDIICVIGHGAEEVRKHLEGVKTVPQKKPLGSGDALNSAGELLEGFEGDLVVLCGDAPLVKEDTIKRLIKAHRDEGNSCTVLTTKMGDPTGYGRISRNDDGAIVKIVEETEASVYDKAIEEINVGAYCFKCSGLFEILGRIKSGNKKGEYFLTDVVELARKERAKIGSAGTDDSNEAIGINSRRQLAMASKVLYARTADRLMDAGVTIVEPGTVFIDKGALVGPDTVIHPNTVIADGVKIGSGCSIGPFARIRRGCEIGDRAEIGNFVELVRTSIGDGSKVKHLTYLGDAVIGKDVNIGAGTITANYDGKGKYKTRIDDKAFIGSGTVLVAPVKVGKGAVTGAGAVLTKNHDIPPGKVYVGIPAREISDKKGA
jgi:bifunctional UDP-N-acetylglucosamine pyrophosphorylase/glucosamine-1-phosphate N-acetyltransferase